MNYLWGILIFLDPSPSPLFLLSPSLSIFHIFSVLFFSSIFLFFVYFFLFFFIFWVILIENPLEHFLSLFILYPVPNMSLSSSFLSRAKCVVVKQEFSQQAAVTWKWRDLLSYRWLNLNSKTSIAILDNNQNGLSLSLVKKRELFFQSLARLFNIIIML